MVKSLFILILLGFWRTALASPGPIFEIQDTMDGPALGPFVEYLVDAQRQYDASSISAAPDAAWRRLAQPFRNFGHLHAPLWLRFQVLNPSDHARTVYFENNYALTDRITLIAAESAGGWMQTLGDKVPRADRNLRYRHPVFSSNLPPGVHLFHIKMETTELVSVAFKVWDPTSFNSMMNLESLLIGLLFGITVALLCYNLILFLSTRIALLAPYCFYVFFFILTEFCLIGISQLVITDPALSRWLANAGFRLFLTLGILAALTFMRMFLNLRAHGPRLDKVTKGLKIALAFLLVYHLAGGAEANLLISAALALCSLHFIVCTVLVVRDGYKPARILLLAWMLIISGSGVASLADLGLLDLDMGRTLTLHFAAGCVEMILLSLAIGEWWREERQRRRQEATQAEAVRVAIQARQDHAFDQLKKIIYPHQLEQIMDGEQLEKTMPVGKGTAAVIAFDIVSSSQADHDTMQEFLRQLFAQCHASMMKGYQPHTLEAPAYRIKETGDGFLCSVGYPFHTAGGQSVSEVAVGLAQEFVRIFHKVLAGFPDLRRLTCCCGIALDRVESFFPKEGVQVYDLYGRAIVLATRYEALRKEIRVFTTEASTIILQERVHQSLSEPMRSRFELMNLQALGVKVRDDSEATTCFVQIIPTPDEAAA
ncbi:MAG TPA: 7TM diverse intracellular signaling domain-containing protein [Oligoflexus sp.]|uniref:7TM diverse intracellular signaling domain-containing protein n=1 Tax=Oligoflexus sp. TaxID=1971216 RepID=UPI002D7E4FBD|nr:7TM diverse intracellular signaling domain-containing protein [Oligoflexus sp.]HET9237671.1 7TM diverse intracellular signaling domain-containing protein [Oligoflexus sp.]